MNFDPKQLSEDENNLVKASAQRYGEFYENACQLVTLFCKFAQPIQENDAFIVFLLLSRRSISLALISILRKHDVQCQLMMRQFLEASILAAFSLENKKLETFGVQTEEGLLEINENAKKQAYKWLNENYGEISKKTKAMKDTINKLASHANLVSASMNCSDLTSFYDLEADHVIKQRLWWIGNVIIGMSDLLIQVNKKHFGFKVSDDFKTLTQNLCKQNDSLKQQSMNDPAFKRWLIQK